jgi:hypothetical protein
VKLFFDSKGQYWLKMTSGFVALGKDDVKLHALRAGVDEKPENNLTAIESLFWRAQTFRMVAYAGPLAGHKAGPFMRTGGENILVTNQCNVFDRPKAKGKSFPFIEGVIEALFDSGHEHVIAWLSVALRSLLKGDFSPGQMLALAGPPGCGKSFFHYLVTELLGGRMAKPYQFLTGKTNFNGDLARAEHLVIEDEAASTDIRTRRNFGSMLKQFTVAEEMHVHDKGKIAFTAPTFKRLTLSVNDEPENLMILPPFDASISDKVMLLQCRDAKGVLHEDRAANKAEIAKELPAFHSFLVSHRVPKSIACPRFGVVAYHHEGLLRSVGETSPEVRLVSLIDEVLFGAGKRDVSEWEGTATELEMALRNSAFAPVASSLFYYPTACGVFLSRLGQRMPDRFSFTRPKGTTVWRVKGGAK